MSRIDYQSEGRAMLLGSCLAVVKESGFKERCGGGSRPTCKLQRRALLRRRKVDDLVSLLALAPQLLLLCGSVQGSDTKLHRTTLGTEKLLRNRNQLLPSR